MRTAGGASIRCLGAFLVLVGLVVGSTKVTRAEVQIQLYGGLNGNFSSDVTVAKGAVNDTRTVDWEGKPFAMPPYWGARGIFWLGDGAWGLAVDYTHAKAYSKINFATDPVYDVLEFTDGNNILTGNIMYRFQRMGYGLRPYLGIGIGVAVPHVEVSLDAFPGQRTFEYQLTGLALQGVAGLEIPLWDRWSAFVEGKLSYTRIDAHLAGGGSLKTDIWSPHLAVGLSYSF